MTISVVIPAYNEEKYIPATLDSVKKLARQPDEIIVIDGKSADRTKEIAQQHGARVITVAHRGIGFARQKGLEAATGDIIAFTDADTIVPTDWLTKIEKTLSRKGVVATYGPYVVDRGWAPYVLFSNYVQPYMWLLLQLIGLPIAPGQNTAFLRQTGLDVGGYPINFKAAEDIEMIRRLRSAGKVVYRFDNRVLSSARRGNEGWALIPRMMKGLAVYYTTRKADTFDFPDIR
jgi:glycosyltransferase involved in cell wall biosynthesis